MKRREQAALELLIFLVKYLDIVVKLVPILWRQPSQEPTHQLLQGETPTLRQELSCYSAVELNGITIIFVRDYEIQCENKVIGHLLRVH